MCRSRKIHDGKNTHTHSITCISLFHCKNGYANAPRWYIHVHCPSCWKLPNALGLSDVETKTKCTWPRTYPDTISGRLFLRVPQLIQCSFAALTKRHLVRTCALPSAFYTTTAVYGALPRLRTQQAVQLIWPRGHTTSTRAAWWWVLGRTRERKSTYRLWNLA
jgi:hypothetical protein